MFAMMLALVNIIVVFGGHPTLRSFVVLNYWGTSLVLLITLVTEAVNSFLNPLEMSVLAHQPIRDGVYFAAENDLPRDCRRLDCLSAEPRTGAGRSVCAAGAVVLSGFVPAFVVSIRHIRRSLPLRSDGDPLPDL
jgi:hypothetical protein